MGNEIEDGAFRFAIAKLDLDPRADCHSFNQFFRNSIVEFQIGRTIDSNASTRNHIGSLALLLIPNVLLEKANQAEGHFISEINLIGRDFIGENVCVAIAGL